MNIPHLLVLGDTHIGSTLAVMKPGYVDIEGQKHEPNKLQAWLWDKWRQMEDDMLEAIGDDAYAVIHMGDVIEGMHHRSTQVVTADAADQALMAIDVLDGLFDRAERSFMVEGTECHTKNTEHALARRLGCTPDPSTGKYAWPQLRLDFNGTRIHAGHHVGTTARAYLESSQFGPTMSNERLWCARQGERMPDHMFRAHRHVFGHYQDDCGMMTVTPAWQGLTRFGHKVVGGAKVTVGAVLLSWEEIGKYRVRPLLYKLKTKEQEIFKV